jgi:hypothetical protein
MPSIVRKLMSAIKTIFSYFNKKYYKTDVVEKNPIFALSKCNYCEGTGSARCKGWIEEYLPSRLGNLNAIHITVCPLCKGTGHVKVPLTNGQ